jgi:hypothetical protein
MAAGADVARDDDEDREERRERRRKRRREPVEEPTPVIGGRLLILGAALIGVAIIPGSKLGSLIEPKDPVDTSAINWKVGGKATVGITLITADYNKLACASDQVIEGFHCAFKSETESFPRDPGAPLDDNKAKLIQPYRTPETNKLILVAGLWAQPDVALRLHREPTVGVDEEKLARFTVKCDVKFIGTLPTNTTKLRWNPGQWVTPDMNAIVARPESCKIMEPEPP